MGLPFIGALPSIPVFSEAVSGSVTEAPAVAAGNGKAGAVFSTAKDDRLPPGAVIRNFWKRHQRLEEKLEQAEAGGADS